MQLLVISFCNKSYDKYELHTIWSFQYIGENLHKYLSDKVRYYHKILTRVHFKLMVRVHRFKIHKSIICHPK